LGGDDLGPTIAADLLLGANAWVDIVDILLLGVQWLSKSNENKKDNEHEVAITVRKSGRQDSKTGLLLLYYSEVDHKAKTSWLRCLLMRMEMEDGDGGRRINTVCELIP
jgi:hypothetical protein